MCLSVRLRTVLTHQWNIIGAFSLNYCDIYTADIAEYDMMEGTVYGRLLVTGWLHFFDLALRWANSLSET